jgi:cell wall-associated NlpC family hydrolase
MLQPGDLIFYAGPEALPRQSLVSHVMMYCGNGIAVGAQGKGRQLDGTNTGVGYYPFRLRAPQGIFGESGTRFLGHRKVFAYGRLFSMPGMAAVNPAAVSIPPTGSFPQAPELK